MRVPPDAIRGQTGKTESAVSRNVPMVERRSRLLPLTEGGCRCVELPEQGNSGQHRSTVRSELPDVAPQCPVVVLIRSQSKGTTFVCRWQRTPNEGGDKLGIIREGSLLCFDKSVRIQDSPSLGKSVGYFPLFDATSSTNQLWSLASLPSGRADFPSSHEHDQAVIKDRLQGPSNSDFNALFVSTGRILPLLGLTLSVDNAGSVPPLQLAHWKRQMIGKVVAGETDGSSDTFLAIRDVFFKVESIISLGGSHGGEMFFIVAPTTRITVVNKSEAPDSAETGKAVPSNARSSDLSASTPFSSLLVQTISCVRRSIPVPRTFLLSGPPGVGKTFSVRLAVRNAKFAHDSQLVSIRGSELLQQRSDAAESLKQHFLKAAAMTNPPVTNSQKPDTDSKRNVTVIFLDECDALVSVGSVAAMLAALLDKAATVWENLIVVGATNRIGSIPTYLRRSGRFDREVPIPPPTAIERAKILLDILRQTFPAGGRELCTDDLAELRRVADLCVGFVPADLTALSRRATLLALRDSPRHHGELSFSTVVVSKLRLAMSGVTASALRDAALSAPPKIKWDDVAGDPGGAKTSLRQAIEWPRLKHQAFHDLGLSPPRGILLHGPPGCAKTTLARAAAGASGVAFLSLSPAEVYASSYVGEAEAVVRRAFALARSASPCVLFFDEIDSIFGGSVGSVRGNSAEARVLSTFLNEMDGVDKEGSGKDGVLVLGATNRPWALDSALLRPGRLGDKIIYTPPPDETARHAILDMQFSGIDRDVLGSNLDLAFLASEEVSGKLTGAELLGACQVAKAKYLQSLDAESAEGNYGSARLGQGLVEEAIRKVKPLLSDSRAVDEFRIFEQNSAK